MESFISLLLDLIARWTVRVIKIVRLHHRNKRFIVTILCCDKASTAYGFSFVIIPWGPSFVYGRPIRKLNIGRSLQLRNMLIIIVLSKGRRKRS